MDTRDLPVKGSQLRLKLRDNLWLYFEVTQVSPTFNIFQCKTLGIHEENDSVKEPEVLKDEKDPEGPTVPIPGTKPKAAARPKTFAEKQAEISEKMGIPPGPASEMIEEKSPEQKKEEQNELF